MRDNEVRLPPAGYLGRNRSVLPSVMNTAMESSVRSTLSSVSPCSNRIRRLLWASTGVSILVFTSSMASLGTLTLWVSPATMVPTTAFHGTLLFRLRRERRTFEVEIRLTSPSRVQRSPGSMLPVHSPMQTSITSRLPTVVSAWVLTQLWTLCFLLVVFRVGDTRHPRPHREEAGTGRIVRQVLEATFTLVEASLVGSIAYLCTTEWRFASRAGRIKRQHSDANVPWHSSGRYHL
ncbi:hypothetical protein FA13DRAFT_73770 [Coprinellus micaceus]|uniref:Uncharacterized protein n=1 Tax=Coprinellus micaceus TaxID=71717 RepID=A0A4Y7TJR1_COPMI|nr:hypothetical protein FA13DRAFT_73770 [Coprinellus micaceus]